MNKQSQIKSLRTRASRQRNEAKALRSIAKGLGTEEAKLQRNKAHRLSELADKNSQKAKALQAELNDLAFRAKQNKITVGEQEILDNLSRQPEAPTETPLGSFTEIYIDTVRELISEGRGQSVLRTPVAQAIDNWLDGAISEYGNELVAYVCQKAMDENPYIFEQYIYDSDQSGMLTNDTLFILNAYADEYIEAYQSQTFDEVELGIDDTIGTEGIYS